MEEKFEYFLVKSFPVAEQLVTKYGFFKDLLIRRKDKFDDNRYVYLFKKSDEIDAAFRQIHIDIKAAEKENKKIEEQKIDESTAN